MANLLIIGATSEIAQQTTRLWALRGDTFYLIGRNPLKLKAIEEDLLVRGGYSAGHAAADLSDCGSHPALLHQVVAALGDLDGVLIAHGILPDQKSCEDDYGVCERVFCVNLLSIVSLLTGLATLMEKRKRGWIAVLSSVAGDRGRRSNYVYGASKAGLDVFLAGLRDRLAASGVQVITVKPGPVRTPMTAHLPHLPLIVEAPRIARGIVAAVDAKRDVVYLPWYWRPIMGILPLIPATLFRSLSL